MATENVIKLAKHSSRIPSHLLHISEAYWNLNFKIFTHFKLFFLGTVRPREFCFLAENIIPLD